MNGWGVLGIGVVFAFFFVMQPIFAETSDGSYATSFSQVGYPVTLSSFVTNPTNQTVNAAIEYVFENIDGDNYWDAKLHSGTASAFKDFGTHQSFFIDDVGRFFISNVSKIEGTIVETGKTQFIVFEEYSDAALNGCTADHELVVKPDYSQAVCVFDESVIKLVQRGWIANVFLSN